MGSCIVCGRKIHNNEESELYGCDGDRIHKSCISDLQKVYDKINNMSDTDFHNFITGKTKLFEQ